MKPRHWCLLVVSLLLWAGPAAVRLAQAHDDEEAAAGAVVGGQICCCGGMAAVYLLMLLLYVLAIALAVMAALAAIGLHIWLVVWIYRDAKARGMGDEAMVWVLLSLFTVFASIAYFFCRPQGDLAPCPYCQQKRLLGNGKPCPHCNR